MADHKRTTQKDAFPRPVRQSAGQGVGHERASAQGPAPGLVTSKTTPNEQQTQGCRAKGEHLDIAFCPEQTARNRVKRLKKNVWFSGRLHSQPRAGYRPDRAYFVTLTYVGVNDWSPEHLTRATDAFRRHCKRHGVPARYLWVAELQRRGAVHYHLVAWLPAGVRMPKWDQSHIAPSGRTVQAFWSHGMTNTQKVKSSAVAYLMKYVSKCHEMMVFPEGLRLFGVGGLDHSQRSIRSWSNLPEWAKCEYGVGELRRCGSRLVVVETGELVEPVWRPQLIPCGLRLTLLRPYPERFHVGPYTSWSPPNVAG